MYRGARTRRWVDGEPGVRRGSNGSVGSLVPALQRPAMPHRTSSTLATEQARDFDGRKNSVSSIGSNYARPQAGTEVVGMPPLQLSLDQFNSGRPPRNSRQNSSRGGRRPSNNRQQSNSSLASVDSEASHYSFGNQPISRGGW